jgi:MFS transporter, SP family, general alpha glucoside:H+ symporter
MYYMNIRKTENARKTLGRLGYSPLDIEKVSELAVSIEESRRVADGATYLECLRKKILLRTLSAAVPMILQTLCGILFVNGYLTYFAELSGFTTSMSYNISIIYAVLSILGNFIAIGCIDKIGRRSLTVYGIISLTALLFITAGVACVGSVPATKATVILFLLYSLLYNASLGTTGYAVLTELPTARLRSKTVSLGVSFQYCLYVSLPPVRSCLKQNDESILTNC